MVAQIICGVIAIMAGLFLAASQAIGSNSMLTVIANGVGWYCVASGAYMIMRARQTEKIAEQTAATKEIVRKLLDAQ